VYILLRSILNFKTFTYFLLIFFKKAVIWIESTTAQISRNCIVEKNLFSGKSSRLISKGLRNNMELENVLDIRIQIINC